MTQLLVVYWRFKIRFTHIDILPWTIVVAGAEEHRRSGERKVFLIYHRRILTEKRRRTRLIFSAMYWQQATLRNFIEVDTLVFRGCSIKREFHKRCSKSFLRQEIFLNQFISRFLIFTFTFVIEIVRQTEKPRFFFFNRIAMSFLLRRRWKIVAHEKSCFISKTNLINHRPNSCHEEWFTDR